MSDERLDELLERIEELDATLLALMAYLKVSAKVEHNYSSMEVSLVPDEQEPPAFHGPDCPGECCREDIEGTRR